MSDLPEVVTPGNSVSLYADDCKTSRVINCPADHFLFQTDIDNIYSWSQQNCMDFNVKKCKLMRICKKRSPFLSDVHFNNSTLKLTPEFCDLGLVTNCNLSWNNHINEITSKANKILRLIKRTCGGLALVKSQLKFFKQKLKLERIQRRATKFFLKTTDEYQQRREKLSLLYLEQRRFLFDVLFLYRASNGHININLSIYVQNPINTCYE